MDDTDSEELRFRSRLYYSTVMHDRVKPVRHRFVYKTGTFLLDLDELKPLEAYSGRRLGLRLFGYNRSGLFSLYDKDYVITPGDTLKQHAQRLLADNGCDPAERIELLCMPHHLGYSFNPLCIFFCYNAAGELYTTLYQVSNTFSQKHIYSVEAKPVQVGEKSVLRHQADKVFYVSPFINMNCQYRFRIATPGDVLKVLIRQEDREGLLLNATLTGKSTPLTAKGLIAMALKRPLFTYKVMAGIHWEALRLWLKKIPLVSRKEIPKPPLVTKGQPLAMTTKEE
ncbi:DUF1365 domain-containing protein [Oceanospirillum linum]|uniref:DUF1365 domain-containing protein n=1 Tax=Oceanospirillum linum TaxID=966 RepID=A0A1T1HBH7_OCELI|nr:DUF1365 domain-containing protein [Oceanospirillum linum]OOV87218.1 hypothetical protein BTA35_0209510 [Oceanospirillum linum]SEF78114.1 hypothetical protein SAMN04489856_102301 [Oleiphilus messinensis]SMP17974.1 hypothetical protein SAMN06264348_103299 [Oceanospirillum linum]